MGIGESLKVGQKTLGASIPVSVKLNALFHLLENWLYRIAVAGVKGVVVAVGAATGAYCSITVGTGETCINGELLNPTAKGSAEVAGVGVVAAVISPGVCSIGAAHLFKRV